VDERTQGAQSAGDLREAEMATVVLMTGICGAGVGFLVRFLVGLCQEQKRIWICYLVSVPPQEGGNSAVRAEPYDVVSPAA
jgi:hypothetical protein